MITVKRLKELLGKGVPDEAFVCAYDGEDVGISIEFRGEGWWIRTRQEGIDTYTEGWEEEDLDEL